MDGMSTVTAEEKIIDRYSHTLPSKTFQSVSGSCRWFQLDPSRRDSLPSAWTFLFNKMLRIRTWNLYQHFVENNDKFNSIWTLNQKISLQVFFMFGFNCFQNLTCSKLTVLENISHIWSDKYNNLDIYITYKSVITNIISINVFNISIVFQWSQYILRHKYKYKMA